jgi:hypothetical protein
MVKSKTTILSLEVNFPATIHSLPPVSSEPMVFYPNSTRRLGPGERSLNKGIPASWKHAGRIIPKVMGLMRSI